MGSKNHTLIRVLLIIACLAIVIVCEISLDNLRNSASSMNLHALDISSIESVGGETLEEAYYQSYGYFLSEQADASLETATILARGIEFLAIIVLIVGSYLINGDDKKASELKQNNEEPLPLL